MTFTSSTHPDKQKERSIIVYKFKISFSEKNFPLIENLRIASLNCFRHSINTILLIFSRVLALCFLPEQLVLLSEWSIKSTAVFIYKTPAFSKKFILNKILSMKIVVLLKYLNSTVNKLQTLALVTLLSYINHIAKYITSILLLIFWYCLLAPVANFWTQTDLKRYIPVPLE